MATTQSNSTSVFGYAEHIDWGALYLKKNLSWYQVMALVIIGYLSLFLIGVVANVLGYRGFNWVTGFVVQIVVLVVSASWMHFVAAGGIGFLAGQAGGEAGLSAADGQKKAWNWVAWVGRFVLNLSLNAPVAFYAIAIWPVKDAPFFAFIVLASSISLAIAAALIWKEGQFWTKLLWFIHLMIVLGAVVFFSAQAIAPEQSKRLASWVEAKFFVNDADRAKDAKEAAIRQSHLKAAEECTKKITVNSTRDQMDRCEALRQNAGVLIYEDEAARARSAAAQRLYAIRIQEAADCYNKLDGNSTAEDRAKCDKKSNDAKAVVKLPEAAPKSVPVVQAEPAPERTTSVAEPARETTQVETAWNCDSVWKEVDYAPGHQFGKVALGTLPAGRYEVTVSGKRQQPFFTGTPAVMNQTCEMNPDGHIGICTDPQGKVIRNNNGDPWFPEPTPFGTTGVLIPSNQYLAVPYGMFVLHAWGKAIPFGDTGAIHTKDDITVAMDVNNFQAPLNYSGQGTFRVQIKQCRQA